jgi:hypothetical protein
MSKTIEIDQMTPEQLARNAARVLELLREIHGLLPGLVLFTENDRAHTDGRVRGPDEEVALRAILATVEHRPEAFQVLADKDQGRDPKKLETDLLRARLECRGVLAGLSDAIAPLAQMLHDTVLDQGELCKPTLSAAYRMAKPMAEHDAALRTKLQPAIDYYASNARKSAASRAAAKATAADGPK